MATTPLRFAAAVALLAATAHSQWQSDVVVYGSTPGAVMSAVAAARQGLTVFLLSPTSGMGGMCSGGLGWTDKGDTFAIGGLAHEFFLRVARTYNASATEPLYSLEPHVAEETFWEMLNVTGVAAVYLPLGLASVTVKDGNMTQVTDAEAQETYSATIFIDGTYEGDLLALAGATMAVGREANTTYGESFGGRREPFSAMDWAPVNPYDNVTGALLPFLTTDAYAAPLGSGDDKVQAYDFRLCVTKAADRIPWSKPASYNASHYALLLKYASSTAPPTLSAYLNNIQPLPNGKYDMNNGGLLSTDLPGPVSWAWPTASLAARVDLTSALQDYQMGFLWTVANDPAFPAPVRDALSAYGLCPDEFTDNGGWPNQVYVREARRLVGDAVFTQADVEGRVAYNASSIGLGSYAFDGHYVHRGPCIPVADGQGCTMWTSPTPPPPGVEVWTGGEGYPGKNVGLYQIPHTVLLPKRAELVNVLAVTTPSASHVAFCSLRMEPQFMILGHAAGDLAALAARGVSAGVWEGTSTAAGPIPVQDVSPAALHAALAKEGAVLCHEAYPHC